MPKRVIDFDAMWGSDKLAACADWAQAEYAWLYGLADASGCFELTNLRVIWGRVAAIRGNLSIERLEQVFREFQDKGLLFVWEHEGKRYGHWTGSDVPGRLPAPSWRMRLERFAPPVPKQLLSEYMARFARGRAALGGGGFRGSETAQANVGALKGGVEEAQAQDLNLDLDRNLERDGNWNSGAGRRSVGAAAGCAKGAGRKAGEFCNLGATARSLFFSNDNANAKENAKSNALLGSNSKARTAADGSEGTLCDSRMDLDAARTGVPRNLRRRGRFAWGWGREWGRLGCDRRFWSGRGGDRRLWRG